MDLPTRRLKNLSGPEAAGEGSLRAQDFDIDFVRSKSYMAEFSQDDVLFVRRAVNKRILALFRDFDI